MLRVELPLDEAGCHVLPVRVEDGRVVTDRVGDAAPRGNPIPPDRDVLSARFTRVNVAVGPTTDDDIRQFVSECHWYRIERGVGDQRR